MQAAAANLCLLRIFFVRVGFAIVFEASSRHQVFVVSPIVFAVGILRAQISRRWRLKRPIYILNPQYQMWWWENVCVFI